MTLTRRACMAALGSLLVAPAVARARPWVRSPLYSRADPYTAIRSAKVHHCCDPARWGQGGTGASHPADEPVLQSHLQGIFTLAEARGFPLFAPPACGTPLGGGGQGGVSMPIGPRLILVLDDIYDGLEIEILDPGDVEFDWSFEVCWWIINGRPSSPSEWWPLDLLYPLPRRLGHLRRQVVEWLPVEHIARIGITPDHPDSGYAFRLVPRNVINLRRSPVIGRIVPLTIV